MTRTSTETLSLYIGRESLTVQKVQYLSVHEYGDIYNYRMYHILWPI